MKTVNSEYIFFTFFQSIKLNDTPQKKVPLKTLRELFIVENALKGHTKKPRLFCDDLASTIVLIRTVFSFE